MGFPTGVETLMVLGFFYKFLAGSVITTFAVYPALADPKSFVEGVTNWFGQFTPVVSDLIGGVI